MNLDSRFLNPIFDEEGGDLGTLISLELDDLTHLLVVNERSIACEFLSTASDKWLWGRMPRGCMLPS